MLSYNNTLIEPLMPSKIKSRFGDEISTSVHLNGIDLRIPIISSPMDIIDNPEFFTKLRQLGGIGIIHRFMSPLEQKQLYVKCPEDTIVAIGANGDWKTHFAHCYNVGARNFLIDIANGFWRPIEPVIKELKDKGCWVMAGNVANWRGYKYLSELGVNAVRVGIGTGSACTTRRMTGIGYPILTALEECYGISEEAAMIADGGIKYPSDMVKALLAGANAIMMGWVFSRARESSSGLKIGSVRTYRGMASYSAQKDAGKMVRAVEGEEFVVRVDKTLNDIIEEFSGGLRSAMSYLNANNVAEIREGGQFIKIDSSMREGFSD